jgi:serine O-acetyltransferase
MNVDKDKLSNLVTNQLKNLFGVDLDLRDYQDTVLNRVEHCFKYSGNKYYYSNQESVFSPFHSVQYSIYLYYLSNTIYKLKGENDISAQLYYLNKVMNSVDWYYEISFPNVFCAEHPLSSVMGRANYSDKFFFYQGCTVGGNKSKYPTIGENVIMYSNSTIVGDSRIGNNVIVSIGTIIKDEVIPSNCIVFGQSPNLTIKQKTEIEIKELSKHFWRDI